MRIQVQTQIFDIGQELQQLQQGNTRIGAVVSFVGYLRDLNQNDAVIAMTLEHYPGMTETVLQQLAQQAAARWSIINCVIIHRVGKFLPGDPIVLVAVATEHRHDAFNACMYIMDYLKTQAPFWKKEWTQDGTRWVDAKASDEDAAGRW